jgi:hypothetical protein
MSVYYGDFAEDATVYVPLTTHAAAGGAVAPASPFDLGDFAIYKNGSATQKTTSNGLTVTSPFDSVTGLHLLAIDTSVDTGDAGFWAVGSDYMVVLAPASGTGTVETVDGQSVVAVVATFSIENRGPLRLRRGVNVNTLFTVGGGSTTTSVVTSSMSPAAAATDQTKGQILCFDRETTTANLRGQKTDITGSSAGGVLTVTALSDAPVSGDFGTIQ